MWRRPGSELFSRQTTCIPGRISCPGFLPEIVPEFPDPDELEVPIPEELSESTSGAVLASEMKQKIYAPARFPYW